MSTQLEPTQLARVRERTLDAVARLPERIGRYEIRGELGHGGMGIVYDAWDPTLERVVAIKVIHDERFRSVENRGELAARFEREMRATSRVFHPNLVAILDAGVEGSPAGPRAYYVMERVSGDSLEQRLRRRGTLPRKEALRVAAAVARGLAAAHDHGLVHRDLKPANVLLPEGEQAKVADFGLCSFRTEVANLRGAGAILGSAHYAAPEQVRAETVSPRADLFALGGILVRIFSGRDPFDAPDLSSHLQRILVDEPDGLETLDADLRGLVLRLVAKDPEQRPASAAAVAQELESLASATPAEPGRSEPVERAASHERRGAGSLWPPKLLSLVVVVLMGLTLAGLLARNHLVTLDATAQTQWMQVENELARRHELIPRLVEITERYAAYEREALAQVLQARQSYVRGGAARSPETAQRLEEALGGVLVLAERYPSLAADRHYQALRHEIAGAANRIAVERMRYNEAVGNLNRRLRQIPWNLVPSSVQARAFFEPPAEVSGMPSLGG